MQISFLYTFCDGNSVQAVVNISKIFRTAEYQTEECLLEFTRHCEIPIHLPAFALRPSVMLMKASMRKKALIRCYRAVHVRVREGLQHVFVLPTRECGEYCMQRTCIHTTCREGNISDLDILLRSWNFASGLMTVASCIVTFCLLNNRNLITSVSIMHTTPMCGQM